MQEIAMLYLFHPIITNDKLEQRIIQHKSLEGLNTWIGFTKEQKRDFFDRMELKTYKKLKSIYGFSETFEQWNNPKIQISIVRQKFINFIRDVNLSPTLSISENLYEAYSKLSYYDILGETFEQTFGGRFDFLTSGLEKYLPYNPYMILNVRYNATSEEVKSAYRVLVKQSHPDVGGNKEDFMKIQEAYEEIMDRLDNKKSLAVNN